jgi:gamma-glutamylputrescine oxidase
MRESVYWYSRRAPQPPRRLTEAIRTDVVVVGGGVAGLSCAQRLRAAGLDVVVVERGFCGAGASGKSSGFITPASEIELRSLIASHGPAEAGRIWSLALSGVELLRANVHNLALECDYQVQDSLFVANKDRHSRAVRAEHEAREQLGHPSRLYAASEVPQVLGTDSYAAALRYGETFSIDPYAYCQGLRRRLEADGVQIYEDTHVTALRGDGVDTPHGTVRARHVVVCADRFIPALGAFQREIYHVQTFLAMSAPLSEEDLRRLFPSGCTMTWDSDLIYSYFRVAEGNRLLLGGGDLLHTYARAPAKDLMRFARRACAYFKAKFPYVALKVEFAWSGMLGVSKDLLPIMGPDPVHDTIWYAGAATGLPWAAALGAYAAERITAARSDFDAVFSPARKFVIGPRMQAWLSTPLTYAISNGIAKYR